MKEDFLIKIETWHKPDLGTQENVSSTSQELQGLPCLRAGYGGSALYLFHPCGGPLCASLFRGLCLDLSYQHGIALLLICKM